MDRSEATLEIKRELRIALIVARETGDADHAMREGEKLFADLEKKGCTRETFYAALLDVVRGVRGKA